MWAKVKKHGVAGLIVYHAFHYGLWVVMFLLAYTLGLDISGPLAPYLAWLGIDGGVNSVVGDHTVVATSWLFALVANKLLIPVKVYGTVKVAPIANERYRRWSKASKA